MMLPSPRIVVIDDEEKDVQAIVGALNVLRTTAVGIHYTPGREIPRFPCLRILFLDLHLLPGALSTEVQIKSTVDLLAQLLTLENGPYAIVLWSGHATERDLFQKILDERLPFLEITAPLIVVSLDKVTHLNLQDHEVSEPENFKDAVLAKIQENPQLAALLAWEEHVAQAVNDTICQIFQMARQGPNGAAAGLDRILGELAIESAGHENAKANIFRAANEVLGQIVSDRLLHRTIREDHGELWKKAVTIRESKASTLSSQESVQLNQLLHLEKGEFETWRRGSIVDLTALSDEHFLDIWGDSRANLLETFDRERRGIAPSVWTMIQVRPPCDEAQQNKGLLPFILGIGLLQATDKEKWTDYARRCDYMWVSPPLPSGGDGIFYLAFHLRFVAGLSAEKVRSLQLKSRYRLREPIMAEISQKLHSYGDRPGIISFKPKK
ncbi:MAG TPA: hypothetical protein VGS07_13875 [Thermoanaerobaculia bacterium]|jgi:hypothetical protein|nr:hypothetical protein [Thermoanaerobaculia bacterium]